MSLIEEGCSIAVGVIYVGSMATAMALATNTSKTVPDKNTPELPSPPSIGDYLDEVLNEPPKIADPLPKSELAYIVFSKTWLLENDQNENPDIIKVTFPISWLNRQPEISRGDRVVLNIPKRMLMLNDSDKDSKTFTVSLPVDMFKGYSNTKEEIPLPTPKSTEAGISGTIDYTERIWYERKVSGGVIRITGSIDPYKYFNNGETFVSYHEREILMDTWDEGDDVIEFIGDFRDDGKVYVRVMIWDDGERAVPWDWLLTDVTNSLQQIDYYFYMDEPGEYDIWLYDTKNNKWYYKSYSDINSPATGLRFN